MRFAVQWMTILLVATLGRGQTKPGDPDATAVAETAALIGVSRDIQETQSTPATSLAGSPQRWKVLALRQRIYERVLTASLQVDSTTAVIDNEIARSAEVRGFLADKRDKLNVVLLPPGFDPGRRRLESRRQAESQTPRCLTFATSRQMIKLADDVQTAMYCR
jgi:hypothetical protein